VSATAREILEARARALAATQEAAPLAVASLTLFRLGGQLYAVRASDVDGAGQLRELSPVPGAPAWLLGATLYRGSIVSLVDLLALWGVPAAGVRDLPSFVVLAQGARRLGLLVDQLLGNLDVEGALLPYEGPEHAGLVELARHGGEPVPVLTAASLLADPRLNP
jgi:purine-binding chemotaxis protein CheW